MPRRSKLRRSRNAKKRFCAAPTGLRDYMGRFPWALLFRPLRGLGRRSVESRLPWKQLQPCTRDPSGLKALRMTPGWGRAGCGRGAGGASVVWHGTGL